MHNMFHEDEVPSEFRCAVRQEGVVELSPMAFFSGLEDSTAAQLLGVAVNSGEIVEMDDGLKHYCFYLELGGARYLPYWMPTKPGKTCISRIPRMIKALCHNE